MAHRILVPFELPDAEPLSSVLIEDLADIEIVALGHYNLPEQTPPEIAREQFGEAAGSELDALAKDFEREGAEVTTRLVFGKDRAKTIDRIAIEEDCDAELDPAVTDGIERILVPLLDRSNLDRLSDFVHALLEDTTTEITLFHVAERGETAEKATDMLEGAREEMIAGGFDPDLIDISVVESDDHDMAILQKADDYDAVVMDEADPNLAEVIFGTLSDKIALQTGDPVIVVRRHHEQQEQEEAIA